jgi:tetratricopeptide (TPR) repeat protein
LFEKPVIVFNFVLHPVQLNDVKYAKELFFCLTVFLFTTASAQSPDFKLIDSLEQILPSLRDSVRVHAMLRIVREKMSELDKETLPLAYEAMAYSRAIGYDEGVSLVYTLLGGYYFIFQQPDVERSKRYLDSALEASSSARAQRIAHYLYSVLHSQHGEFDKSHNSLAKALEANGAIQDDTTALITSVMAFNLAKIGRKEEAEKYYRQSIAIYEKKRSPKQSTLTNLGATVNNFGGVLMEMNNHPEALRVFNRLFKLEEKHGNPLDNPSMLANLGKLYLVLGKADSAYYYMHAGLRAPSIKYAPYAYTLCLNMLAQYHLQHDADSALYYGHAFLKSITDRSPLMLEEAHQVLARAYARKKRFDSAYYHQQQFQMYHDSVFQEKRTQQIAALEAAFEFERKEKQIASLRAARQNEIFRRNVMGIGLALTVGVAVLIIYFMRLNVHARKRELVLKNSQLEYYTRAMVEKSERIEELRTQIEKFREEVPDVSQERVENLAQILNLSILTERDWEEFKTLFEQVHPNFFAGLKIKYPALSAAEVRLSALLKLNLSNKEIANMLGISADSVHKARYRLRKKLELTPEQELPEVIDAATREG